MMPQKIKGIYLDLYICPPDKCCVQSQPNLPYSVAPKRGISFLNPQENKLIASLPLSMRDSANGICQKLDSITDTQIRQLFNDEPMQKGLAEFVHNPEVQRFLVTAIRQSHSISSSLTTVSVSQNVASGEVAPNASMTQFYELGAQINKPSHHMSTNAAFSMNNNSKSVQFSSFDITNTDSGITSSANTEGTLSMGRTRPLGENVSCTKAYGIGISSGPEADTLKIFMEVRFEFNSGNCQSFAGIGVNIKTAQIIPKSPPPPLIKQPVPIPSPALILIPEELLTWFESLTLWEEILLGAAVVGA